MESSPGRHTAHADANSMAVAYVVAAQAPLALVASAGGDDDEYICIPANHVKAMRSPQTWQWQHSIRVSPGGRKESSSIPHGLSRPWNYLQKRKSPVNDERGSCEL